MRTYRIIERNDGKFELEFLDANKEWQWRLTERSLKEVKKRIVTLKKQEEGFKMKRVVEHGELK